MKNSNDTIGNRTRKLPACSAVPQPTEPPRSSMYKEKGYKIEKMKSHCGGGMALSFLM